VRREPGSDPGPIDVGFTVNKVALETGSSLDTSVFPCENHAINTRYAS
jgi:hypothetical protein